MRHEITNTEIARLLRHVAVAYSIKDEQQYKFQIIAYQRAADAIEQSSIQLKDIISENKKSTIPGVGPSIKGHITELLSTGKVAHFEDVMKGIPASLFPLLDVPSFGPKKAYKIIKHFHLQNPDTVIDDVERLATEGRIAELEGFGEKSEKDILRAIAEFRLGKTKTTRMVLPFAFEIAQHVLEYLKQSPDVVEAYPLGSLRRMKSTIGDVDIAVATKHPEKVLEYFTKYPHAERIVEKGTTTASLLTAGGKQVDLMVQPPESFGSLLQHFTGSKQHNVDLREYALRKGLSLSEYGIKRKKDQELVTFSKEEAFYNYLGLEWIPPEMREAEGEIELASKNKLPKLVELSDIKGDLQIHSNYPIEPSHDLGKDSMQDIINKAKELGYTYVAFSEHNPSIGNHTHQQIYDILLKRNEYIEQIKKSNKDIRVINLLEIDILSNGSLALNNEELSLLDAAIVSIHSAFSMNEEEMTRRILSGLDHPKVKIFAHPTGRILNQRPGYEADWEKIYDFCAKRNIAIEINAWPSRLDLPDTMVKTAKEKGVKFVIDTDAHAASHMDNMFYGVAEARRGWCTKEDILNTLPYDKLEEWIKS